LTAEKLAPALAKLGDLFHSGQLERVAARLGYSALGVTNAIERLHLAARVGRRFSRRGRPRVLYCKTWQEEAMAIMESQEIRYWKNPEWRYKGADEERTLCLILTHPGTGGRFSSFDFPVGAGETDQKVRARLTAWANELAGRSERMKGL